MSTSSIPQHNLPPELWPCPGCGEPNAIGEVQCGHCGIPLDSEHDSIVQSLRERKRRIMELRREGHYDAAVEMLEAMSELPGDQFEEYRNWATSRLRQLDEEQLQKNGGVKKLIENAREEILHCHYRRALKHLKQIPAEHLTDEARLLHEEAIRLRDESNELAERIRVAVETRNPTGLLSLVRRYHELRPHDKSITRLKNYLEGKVSGNPDASPSSAPSVPPDLPPSSSDETT